MDKNMGSAQELIQRLNQSGKKLSKSHRRIAECIVTHYDKAAFMTASKLGEYVGVSESTVVRFASTLGYAGYPQLQKALQEIEAAKKLSPNDFRIYAFEQIKNTF